MSENINNIPAINIPTQETAQGIQAAIQAIVAKKTTINFNDAKNEDYGRPADAKDFANAITGLISNNLSIDNGTQYAASIALISSLLGGITISGYQQLDDGTDSFDTLPQGLGYYKYDLVDPTVGVKEGDDLFNRIKAPYRLTQKQYHNYVAMDKTYSAGSETPQSTVTNRILYFTLNSSALSENPIVQGLCVTGTNIQMFRAATNPQFFAWRIKNDEAWSEWAVNTIGIPYVYGHGTDDTNILSSGQPINKQTPSFFFAYINNLFGYRCLPGNGGIYYIHSNWKYHPGGIDFLAINAGGSPVAVAWYAGEGATDYSSSNYYFRFLRGLHVDDGNGNHEFHVLEKGSSEFAPKS